MDSINKEFVIGIDVGGQTTKCGVVDARGQVLSQTVIRSDDTDDENVYISTLADSLHTLIAAADVVDNVRGIGVGAPNGNYYTGTIEFAPKTAQTSMPAFTGSGFAMVKVPVAALLLVLCGLCTSVMWGTIFDLAVEGLGAATNKASGIFMAMVVGGGILPLVQNFFADKVGYMPSYWIIIAGLAYILFFAVAGSKVAKRA